MVQAILGKKQDAGAGRVVQVVEHLPISVRP
jgi:hypothetical protein